MQQPKKTTARIAPQAIRAQLGRILESGGFIRCSRMQRFLQFIVEETLSGRTHQLGEYAIGVEVFDRGADFEPAVDPIVRNDARRLRQKLAEYYRLAPPETANVVIDMPKGGYVPTFLPRQDSSTATARRIAVLPFECVSADGEESLQGRALSLSLTAKLTNVDGLETVAHGYARAVCLHEAAAQLRLSHAIHGSVWNSGGRCHIVINLIEALRGTQIWAREFELAALDAAADVAGLIVREVRTHLGLHSNPPLLAVAA